MTRPWIPASVCAILNYEIPPNRVVGQEKPDKKPDDESEIKLGRRDVLALAIAALETVLLPLVIFIVVLLVVTIYVSGHL